MKIYQIIECICRYDYDEIIRTVLHTFNDKNKAEEMLKKYEEELKNMSPEDISNKICSEICDPDDVWYEIENFEVEQ